MKILLDTSAIIEYGIGNAAAVNLIESADEVYTSVLCRYEASWREVYNKRKGKRTGSRIISFLDEIKSIELNDDDAQMAAEIRAELEIKGNPTNAVDVLISAQALNRDLVIVTADKDFLAISKHAHIMVEKIEQIT